jgi:hypothetical protein
VANTLLDIRAIIIEHSMLLQAKRGNKLAKELIKGCVDEVVTAIGRTKVA